MTIDRTVLTSLAIWLGMCDGEAAKKMNRSKLCSMLFKFVGDSTYTAGGSPLVAPSASPGKCCSAQAAVCFLPRAPVCFLFCPNVFAPCFQRRRRRRRRRRRWRLRGHLAWRRRQGGAMPWCPGGADPGLDAQVAIYYTVRHSPHPHGQLPGLWRKYTKKQ